MKSQTGRLEGEKLNCQVSNQSWHYLTATAVVLLTNVVTATPLPPLLYCREAAAAGGGGASRSAGHYVIIITLHCTAAEVGNKESDDNSSVE